MRIIHIFNTLDATLGADILTRFPKSDEITVVSLLAGGPSAAVMEQAGITVINLNALPDYSKTTSFRALSLLRVSLRLIRNVRAIVTKVNPEIVHTHLWLSDIIGALAAQSLPVRLFSTQHDTQKLPFAIAVLKRRLLRRYTSVVAISRSVADFTREYLSVAPEKITSIYNGINVAAFSRAQKKSPAQLTLGMISRLEYVKGHTYVLQALKKLKDEGVSDLKLSIFGSGSREQALRKEVVAYNLTDIVTFKGYATSVVDALSEIDIFIQPSLSEGLGVTILEALAAHKLVIASAVGGIPELIKDKETGLLVPPADSDALATAIRYALTQRAEAEALRARATTWFDAHAPLFDIDQTAFNYRSLYA